MNPNLPSGYTEVRVEFTKEESEAITSSMDEYASTGAAQHGGAFAWPKKVENGMKAKALAEYAADLLAQCDDSDSEEWLRKASQAQAKAYALHNLPIYIFQLAGIYEVAGDAAKAKDWYKNFLRAQDEFTPDGIDSLLLNQSGFDMARVIVLAKQKLDGSLPGDSVGARFVVVPIIEVKRHAIATTLISISNDAIPSFCAQNMTALGVDPAHRTLFECLCYALLLSVAEVVVYSKYTEEDAQGIMIRAFECFFGEPSEERLATSFQEAFNHAHERYVNIWQLSVPLLNLTEVQMYEEWARTFASELAVFHKISCSQRNVERWALTAIEAFRGGCHPL